MAKKSKKDKLKTKDGSKHKDAEKSFAGETLSMIIWALGIAIILRTFLFQPFHIPSGSMEPNLVKGDYIITSKFSVGYGKYAADPLPFPARKSRFLGQELTRGDILVFKPLENKKTFIKRLAGLPGDQMQMRSGKLYINGEKVETSLAGLDESKAGRGVAEIWDETFPGRDTHQVYNKYTGSDSDDTDVFTVPAGYYFLLGDNRDQSADSRVPITQGGAGYVPSENIIGRAEFVLLSVSPEFSLFKPWSWGNMRGERFFKGLR